MVLVVENVASASFFVVWIVQGPLESRPLLACRLEDMNPPTSVPVHGLGAVGEEDGGAVLLVTLVVLLVYVVELLCGS
jgi:hypothetical protein